VVLFRASHLPLAAEDPYHGWIKYFVHGMEVREVTCDHDNILLEPQVRMVAETLKMYLDEAPTAVDAAEAVNS
jgi:thioesterase domain-containing protein